MSSKKHSLLFRVFGDSERPKTQYVQCYTLNGNSIVTKSDLELTEVYACYNRASFETTYTVTEIQ